MKFLGDIPIGRATIEHLAAHGHDAVHVSALLPSTVTDLEIVVAAIREGRTILCFDLDFSAIVAVSGLRGRAWSRFARVSVIRGTSIDDSTPSSKPSNRNSLAERWLRSTLGP